MSDLDDLGPNVRIPMRDVATRYGVSLRTMARWVDDEALQFPQPIYIRGRRYVTAGDLRAWEELQPDRLGRKRKPSQSMARAAE